jgi:ATP-dependent protease HslVU (ClpYQ) peptidase subunit
MIVMAKKIYLIAFINFIISSQAQLVSTVAGSTQGYLDGNSTTAQFNVPLGLAVDINGNIYIADYYNHKIRKITEDGVVSTVAGTTQGYMDGLANIAQFNHPNYIAIDNTGNLYVSDLVNRKIRKITPSGMVSTFAGSSVGTADGHVSVAQFTGPAGLAFDSQGNLFVSDSNRIRKIDTNGIVSTFAGSTSFGFADGLGASARFSNPIGIAIDSNNIIYVCDYANQKVRMVTPEGLVSTLAGSTVGYEDGVGNQAKFNGPCGIATDSNSNVYVTDEINCKIRKIDTNGNVSTLAGSTLGYSDGFGTEAKFKYPAGIFIDPNENVYVGDNQNYKVRKIVQNLNFNEHNFQNEIILYPNPATETLKIEFNGMFMGKSTINIKDIIGKEIYSNIIQSNDIIIDISNYFKGIYFVSIFDGNKTLVKKFIVK